MSQNSSTRTNAADPIPTLSVCVAIALCFLLAGCGPRSEKPSIDISVLSRPEPDAIYVELRNRVFNGTAQDFKVESLAEGFPLWGVVVEHGLPNGTATLVCFANGEASLYLSSGSGLADTSVNPEVRSGARNLVGLAAQQVSNASPAESWPTPAIGEVAFWFLSTNQIFSARASDHDLQEETHPLSKLYRSANALLTQMHLVAAEIQSKSQKDDNQENTTALPNNQPSQ